jgi:hypothetical protein
VRGGRSFSWIAGLLFLALGEVLTAKGSLPDQPRRLLTGSFLASQLTSGPPPVCVFRGGSREEASLLLARFLPGAFLDLDGKKRFRDDLVGKLQQQLLDYSRGGWWIQLTPPIRSLVNLQEGLRRRSTRLEFGLDWSEGDAPSKVPMRRWFSLWLLPRTEPVLLGRIRQELPGGLERRLRYVGPWQGWPQPGRGWINPRVQEFRPAPVRELSVSPLLTTTGEVFETPRRPPGEPVDFRVLAQGEHAGVVRKASRKVIRSRTELEREWKRIYFGAVPVPSLPDFEPLRELILVLYLGETREAPGSIRVEAVRRRSDGVLEVSWKLLPSAPTGGRLLPSSPYLVLKANYPATSRVEFRRASL